MSCDTDACGSPFPENEEGEQKGRKEGEQKGRKEGRQEGASLVLAQLLSKKFQADQDVLMPLLSKLATERQEELVEVTGVTFDVRKIIS